MRLAVWSLLVLGFCGQVVQAKVPFTLEGKWLLNRNNATMAKVLKLDKCNYKNCQFTLYNNQEEPNCVLRGTLLKNTQTQGIVSIDSPKDVLTICTIEVSRYNDNKIQLTSRYCRNICPGDITIDGVYENAQTPQYYDTGYNCNDERLTYAEAAVCRNWLLSLGEREIQKLSKQSTLPQGQIERWLKQRNFCQNDLQCLTEKYVQYIKAQSSNISKREFNLQTYYRQTQARYGSPFESFLTALSLQQSLTQRQLEHLQSFIGTYQDKSENGFEYITYTPQNGEDLERTAFYLKDNEMWLGFLDIGESGLEEIFLFAPKGKDISETPLPIQRWEKKFQNINCPDRRECPEDTFPVIYFTPTL